MAQSALIPTPQVPVSPSVPAPTAPEAPRMDTAGATHVGLIREANEDAYLIATLQRSILVHEGAGAGAAPGWFSGGASGTVLAVADGMGGMGDGGVASGVAIQEALRYLLNVMTWQTPPAVPSYRGTLPSVPGLREELAGAVAGSDSAVRRAAQTPGVSSQMGTTLTLAYLSWPLLYVAHVGDSRCYLNRGDALLRLTTDHTVAEDLKSRGIASDDVPQRFGSLLWNAIGGDDRVPLPQIQRCTLTADDCILLCSDGLTRHVSDDEIGEILRGATVARVACAQLVELANERGGSDNTTVVVARVLPPASTT